MHFHCKTDGGGDESYVLLNERGQTELGYN